jgi:hypothetical protein
MSLIGKVAMMAAMIAAATAASVGATHAER